MHLEKKNNEERLAKYEGLSRVMEMVFALKEIEFKPISTVQD